MRAPLIGGVCHGQSVFVTDPPLACLCVAEDGPLLCMRTEVRIEQYKLTYWVDGNTILRTEYPVYLHGSLSEKQAQQYVDGWFKTGVLTPLCPPTSDTRP